MRSTTYRAYISLPEAKTEGVLCVTACSSHSTERETFSTDVLPKLSHKSFRVAWKRLDSKMPVAYSMSYPHLSELQIKTEERGPPPSYEEVIGYRVLKFIGMLSFVKVA